LERRGSTAAFRSPCEASKLSVLWVGVNAQIDDHAIPSRPLIRLGARRESRSAILECWGQNDRLASVMTFWSIIIRHPIGTRHVSSLNGAPGKPQGAHHQ